MPQIVYSIAGLFLLSVGVGMYMARKRMAVWFAVHSPSQDLAAALRFSSVMALGLAAAGLGLISLVFLVPW